jgi:hypothetical protein
VLDGNLKQQPTVYPIDKSSSCDEMEQCHNDHYRDESSVGITRLDHHGLQRPGTRSAFCAMPSTSFHRERVAAFGTLMTDTTLKWTQRWETSSFRETNKPLDLAQEMSSLTMNIVGKALFGTDLSAETERVGRALTTVNHLLAEAFYLL